MLMRQSRTRQHLFCARLSGSRLRQLPLTLQLSVVRKASPHFVKNHPCLWNHHAPRIRCCPSKIDGCFHWNQDLPHLRASHCRFRKETTTHQNLKISLPFRTLARNVTTTPFHPMAERPSSACPLYQVTRALTGSQASLCHFTSWQTVTR
jgi:hypothetical protein